MTRVPTFRAWVGAVACSATALGFAAGALAQQDEQRNQDQSQQTSDEQRRQQDQEQRQSDQQYREQRDQQSQRQREDARSRQRSQEELSTWPEPNRDGFSGQGAQYQQYDQERQMTRSGGRANEQDAGLGVNIISDRGPGIVVTRVFRGTPADQMGIQENDRITQLNGQDVRSVNEFISRIRNMNPGDEVELEVLRNRDEQTVRGELETRQEALLLSNRQQTGRQWQQGDRSWQTGYQESGTYGGFQQQGRTMRGGDYSNRLNSIEQRVSQLSRELQQIRFALQDLRQSDRGSQQFGRTRESQAGYDEYQGGYESQRFGTRPQSDQWDGRSDQGYREFESYQDGGQQRQFEGDQSRARDAAEGGREGPAGITGSRRTRPDSDLDRLDQ